MRVISVKTLREFWQRHPAAEQPLRAWFHDVKGAKWRTPADIKAMYRNASIVGNNRVVFNIKGNSYRLVVAVNYPHQILYIRFIGTHQEYDTVNVETV
jgi:mRNA interferase HigB